MDSDQQEMLGRDHPYTLQREKSLGIIYTEPELLEEAM
jgi:hypothetical protein